MEAPTQCSDPVISRTSLMDRSGSASSRLARPRHTVCFLPVATHVGGNAKINRDGNNGLLVHEGDSSVLTDAMLRLLHDPVFSAYFGQDACLGQNGREFGLREFGFPRLIENADQLFMELLQSRGLQ